MLKHLRFKKIDLYKDGWEHLADEFRLLDLRINALIVKQRQVQGDSLFDQFRGLVVSEEEALQLLGGSSSGGADIGENDTLVRQMAQLESNIQERRRMSLRKGIFLPLAHIGEVFGLTPFEERVLVICLALAFDRRYEKLYAFLHDDVTRKEPTLDLASRLMKVGGAGVPESILSLASRGGLRMLLVQNAEEAAARTSLLSRGLRLETRVVSFFLHPDEPEESLQPFLTVFNPTGALEPLVLGEELQRRMQRFAGYSEPEKKKVVYYLWGPPGIGKKLQARHLCRFFGQSLVVADLDKILNLDAPFTETVQRVTREAVLRKAALCFENCQVLLARPDEAGGEGNRPRQGASLYRYLHEVIRAGQSFPNQFFLLSESPFRHPELIPDFSFVEIELSVPGEMEREMLWRHFSQGYECSEDIDWSAMAGKFRFTPGQILGALARAADEASWKAPGRAEIETEVLHRACFSQGRHNLGQKAVKVEPRYTWEDIILPPETKEQLRNGCNQIKYRSIVYDQWGFGNKLAYGKGLTMLFSGQPGTGKTMAAQVMASELNLELYKIDLSQVISKYIGETEKNLQQIFNEARYSNAILFFDEADALFGKRSEVKDAHDRYANIETAYLLQKVEEYDGVSILATNLMKNLDEAFRRRLNFLVEFPFPDPEYREMIWRSMFPRETPVARDVEFEMLARKLEIAGGNIKNIVVAAAFLAAEMSEPVGMEHIVRAARYELQKIGLTMLKKDIDDLLG
ncbi:MAG: ATP-binding protein [Firmicutes bacterium]|nr:ATP-binding protein [Bacillota bacterium]